MGLATIFFKKVSLSSHFEPNVLAFEVNVSLVYESNAGFTI